MPRQDTATRFWSKVEKTDGCWLWVAAQDNKGYGIIQIDKQARKAHRFVYELTYGPIPNGLFVCHTCDNPQCVRPDHLWLGTAADNNHDRDRKGRTNAARGDRHGSRTHPERYTGPNNPAARPGILASAAKLTDAEVIAIRQRYAAGGCSLRELGIEYGVHKATIHLIVTGKNWRHLKEQQP